MESSFLDKTIGEKEQQIYTKAVLLVYLAVLATFSFLSIGTLENLINEIEWVGASWSGSTDSTEYSSLFQFALLSGLVLATILRMVVYSRMGIVRKSEMSKGDFITKLDNVSEILKNGLLTPISYLFWFFVSILILGSLSVIFNDVLSFVEIGRNYSLIFQGVGLSVAFIISSGLALVISSLGGGWRFPSDLRENVEETHERLDETETHIANAEEEIDSQRFQMATTSLGSANDTLQTVKRSQISFPVISRRIRNSEKNIEEMRVKLVEKALSTTEQAISQDEYQRARATLDSIDEVTELFEPSNEVEDRIQSLEEKVSMELEGVVAEKMEGAHSRIKQADDEGDRGDFSQAYQHIECAKEAIDEVKEITGQKNPDGIDTQLHKVEKRVSQQESEEDILKIRDSISDTYGIEKSKIKTGEETPRSYERLESLLGRIESSESSKATFLPWDQFRSGVLADLPGISKTQIDTCHSIISDVETIVEFLETIDESHPSVHADEWRDAMKTALLHQNQDILNPVTSQINRLQGNTLWKKEDLHKVDWEEFEHLIGLLYEDLGYDAEVTQGTSDMGIDVWAKKDDERVAIQVKQFSDGNTVGRETLQKLTSTIAKGDAERAVVITSGDFARTAEQYAKDFGSKLEIIDGEELIKMLSESDVPVPV